MKKYTWSVVILLLVCLIYAKLKESAPQEEWATTMIIPMEVRNKESIPFVSRETNTHRFIQNEFQWHEKDIVFDSIYTTNDYLGAIHIGCLFYPDIRSAILEWAISDSLIGFEVRHYKHGKWKKAFQVDHIPSIYYSSGFNFGKTVDLSDFNGDFIPDLLIYIEEWHGIGTGYRCKLWLTNKNSFTEVRGFDAIVSPEYDVEQDIICSYESGGCADMAMHFSLWKLQSDSVHCFKNINLDCCVTEDSCCRVTIDDDKSILVHGHKVYLHAPRYYREQVKEKMMY
jgi:hypothetical protein